VFSARAVVPKNSKVRLPAAAAAAAVFVAAKFRFLLFALFLFNFTAAAVIYRRALSTTRCLLDTTRDRTSYVFNMCGGRLGGFGGDWGLEPLTK
jgi:hypothetical protein